MRGVKWLTWASGKERALEGGADGNFNPSAEEAPWEQGARALPYALFLPHSITWDTEGAASNQISANPATFLDY